MGILKTAEKFNIWLLHLVCMKEINHKVQAIMICCNNHPLLKEGNKSPLQLCQDRILKYQVVHRIIDPDILNYLSEWQGIDPLPEDLPPTISEPTHYANAKMIKWITLLKFHLLKNLRKSKNTHQLKNKLIKII